MSPPLQPSLQPSLRRWGLVLVNLGTPAAPAARAVRRYLRELLSDPRVLDVPWPWRRLLLEAVILPFRPARSAEAYAKVWTDRGSPLLVHSQDLLAKVRARLPAVQVELGMRYGEPTLASALERLHAAGRDRVALFPLYPQHAASSTGSTVEAAFRQAAARWAVPSLQVVPAFYDRPEFLDPMTAQAMPVIDEVKPERVLMSFHGLPERQVTRCDPTGGHCLKAVGCCDAPVAANASCYRHHCFVTARGLAARLELAEGTWEVMFQSRLGRTPWLRPFTDVRVQELAAQGTRRLVVLCPAFVADCLETLEEIGLRLRDDFLARGGHELRLVPGLNATDAWADGVVKLARDTTGLPGPEA